MQLAIPNHNKYFFSKLEPVEYNAYAEKYSSAKKIGFRVVCAWASGANCLEIVREFSTGSIRQWGRKEFGTAIIGGLAYVCSPVIVFVTNSTRIINASKKIYSLSAFAFECIEDSSNLLWIPLDFTLFGQPIPLGDPGRLDVFGSGDMFD